MGKPPQFSFEPRDTGAGTPRPGDYIARLDDRTGKRVWCGKTGHTCYGELATVAEAVHRLTAQVRRRLMMAETMKPNDQGVWHLSNRAQAQADLGHRGRARRGRLGTRTTFQNPGGTTIERGHNAGRPRREVLALPIVALCPRCGHRNVLAADTLRVEDELAAAKRMRDVLVAFTESFPENDKT